MSTIKNFGIAGVGSDLQLGKKGGRMVYDAATGTFKFAATDGVTVSRVQIGAAVEQNEAVALSQLDAAVSTIGTTTDGLRTDVDAAQAELDVTQTGAGLEVDGTYVSEVAYDATTAPAGAHYVDGAVSLKDADKKLDAAIKAVSDASGAAQSELDATQAAAGLDAEGAYVARTGSNYLDSATTLHGADTLLDSAIKSVSDSAVSIQSELDATQVGAGLGADGSYTAEALYDATTAPAGAHYIHAASSLTEADKILDAKIKEVADAAGQGTGTVQSELDATQSGAGLAADGAYVSEAAYDATNAPAGAHYIHSATSLAGADKLLDSAIKSNADALAALGNMADQNAESVAITGGAIDGAVIGGTAAAAGTFTDVVINGNLTVNGDTTTLDVANLAVEDNIIEVNRGEAGAGVTAGSAGLEVNRGTEQNAVFVWDEATDSWTFKMADGSAAKIAADFSNVSVSDLDAGLDNQVLTSEGGVASYKYVDALRDASGKAVIGQGTIAGTGGEFLEFSSVDGEITLTAKNAAGTGDVDLILAGQGNGDVIIAPNANNEGLIIADDDTTLTVSGGNSSAADAGDMVIKGGNGSTTFASGDVVIQGGTGGSAEGITLIKDSAGNEITSFGAGVANATDFVAVKNGIGSASIEAAGDSVDVDLVLSPKGNGLVVASAGYDVTGGVDEALANKGYVDSQVQAVAANVDPLVMRSTVVANSTDSSFVIGTMSNVAGKQYFVSRVTLHVSADFSVAEQMIVSDGTATLASADESDVQAGTYVIDLPFAVATAGGASISVQFQDAVDAAAVPAAGSMVAVVEYKVV